MKFTIDVELDYIDEDGCLDESIKESILKSITQTVMKKVDEQVDSQLNKIVLEAAQKKADKICDQIAEDFMTREFTKIDSYGDTIEAGLTVKELLKRNFADFWSAVVTEDGKNPKSYRNEPNQTRIEWKIDALIEKKSKEFAKILVDDTDKKIKNAMRTNMQDKIGKKLVSELGLDKLLLTDK